MRILQGLLSVALAAAAIGGDTPPSFIIVLADDLGVDNVRAYGEHPFPPKTTRLDELAEQGLMFRNAYANPNCTPSRVSLITGSAAWRTGIGWPLPAGGGGVGLPVTARTFPKILGDDYRRVFLGKWHLNSRPELNLAQYPLEFGFDSFRGTWFNLNYGAHDYRSFRKIVLPGPDELVNEYLTTHTIDDAIREVEGATKPLFLLVSLHAPHSPYHEPPPHLHSTDTSSGHPAALYKAMVEAMDTEVGRLIDCLDQSALSDSTYVIFLGDNGTPGSVTTEPFDGDRAKGTVYEAGVNVPLIVRGPGVQPGECQGLVHISDIAGTVLELAGVPLDHAPDDSVSLVPYFQGQSESLREFVYFESFGPNGSFPANRWQRAARNERYKLIWWGFPDEPFRPDEFFDLQEDPWELNNLLFNGALSFTDEERKAFRRLTRHLERQGNGRFD